ncbi:hypothetical protein [Entomobacter blattae]|uniref:Uncharacterized protein n=1 Tax=Entomobacter blattae TaxID=2762277 RepID=A0A7H1NQD1_9PROT|nr:hypothetical protein [Entomobacter blattae]QNT77991.1 hypothetical protein JGUZn3_07560 [Entomobacter blattae]
MVLTLLRVERAHGPIQVDSTVAAGLSLPTLYPLLAQEISEACSSEHAHILATPSETQTHLLWTTQGQVAIPFSQLAEPQQQQLIKAAATILADIETFARKNPHSTTAQNWPAIACFPSLTSLFAVDGRPVITQWAMQAPSAKIPSAPLTPFMPQQPNPRPNLRSSLTSLLPPFPLATALISLAAGLITALLWQTIHTPLKLCYAQWPQATTLQNAQKHQQEFNTLNAQKQNLLKQIQAHKQQCALPTWKPDSLQPPPQQPTPLEDLKAEPLPELNPPTQPNKLQVPTAKPKPEPKPEPKVEPQQPPQEKPKPHVPLPKEAWDKHDKTMLKGCWQLSTRLFYGKRFLLWDNTEPVTNWTMCYDQNGNGYQSLQLANGNSCRSALSANFAGNTLRMHAPTACSGSFNFQPGPNVCTRVSDQEASCVYTNPDGSTAHGIFRRR